MSKALAALSFILLTLVCGTSVLADTIMDTNVKFTATVTGTVATLQIQCLNATACGSWYIGDVTLKGFSFGHPILGTSPSGYTLKNGGQNNNAVGANGGCNGTQRGKAVCWDAPTTLDILGTDINTFTANIGLSPDADADGLSPGTLRVLASFYNDSGIGTHGNKVLSVSDNLAAAPVPEPASMLLFGMGLLTLGALRRRPAKKT